MEFSGTYLIFSDRAAVWGALNDVEVLKKAIPRCETISWSSENTLDLTIKVNFGIIKPKFSGELELSNIVEAQNYTLAGRGQGGLLGLARGSADIQLQDEEITKFDILDLSEREKKTVLVQGDMGTILSFVAHGGASDKIMALGKNLIGKSAQGIIDRFMGRFCDALGAPMLPIQEDDD